MAVKQMKCCYDIEKLVVQVKDGQINYQKKRLDMIMEDAEKFV